MRVLLVSRPSQVDVVLQDENAPEKNNFPLISCTQGYMESEKGVRDRALTYARKTSRFFDGIEIWERDAWKKTTTKVE